MPDFCVGRILSLVPQICKGAKQPDTYWKIFNNQSCRVEMWYSARASLSPSLSSGLDTYCRLRRLSRRRGPVNCSSETVESCVLRAAPCSLTSVLGTGPDAISLLRYPNMKCHCPVVSAMQLDHNNSATMIEAESKFVYLIKHDPHGVKTRLMIGKVASMDGCLRSARFSIREALLFNHIRTRSARVPSLSIDPIGLPMASH